jgi:hypothetical protein
VRKPTFEQKTLHIFIGVFFIYKESEVKTNKHHGLAEAQDDGGDGYPQQGPLGHYQNFHVAT